MSSFARRRGLLTGSAVAFFAAVALSVSGFPAGCAQQTPCQFNSDCVNAYCSAGVCKQDCVDSEQDCPQGFRCSINAQCVAGDGGPSGSGGGASSTASAGGGGAATTGGGAS